MKFLNDIDLSIDLNLKKGRDIDDFIIRIADIIFATICLMILAAIMPTIIVMICIDSHGTPIFMQKRAGKNGIPFIIYKFRTMCEGAEKLCNQFRNENEPVVKIAKDNRITMVGAFLRKFSIDEFPQFLNILKGDMSFVGPRPPIMEEYNAYTEYQKARLASKPGLTGLAQINGRSDLDFDSIVKYDIFYNMNGTIFSYFKIILKTIPYMLLCKSSY